MKSPLPWHLFLLTAAVHLPLRYPSISQLGPEVMESTRCILPAGEFYLGVSTVMPPSPNEELSQFIEVAGDMQGVDLVLSGSHE